ncbi:cation:proton antiporter [Aestuariibacter sp. AA17]|uniref:Cation:proton antiporter n=1 Tax=Fluctibacter corallii TaxID=2984329 RepID=A0ABT3A8J6_9ALTE|nr:monovalent cation:proton antiporter family protein [Aestuariibacter sp. AA17]MCV2885008.1 cation:proton antiporter [Aestuariibacter sp. AA17]
MHGIFFDVLILMSVAIVMVWLFKRINLPPILAYLVCGILAGHDILALFEHPEEVQLFAELGIVFLLFSLGLEFSLPKMIAMRHMVFGVGLGQMVLTTGFFMLVALLCGLTLSTAFVIGTMVALSSTAIVIKQISELGILNTRRSQMAVSVLLFQDLAVVPILILIPLLANPSEQSMALMIAMALLKGTIVVAILMSVGKWLLPRLFSEIAQTRTDELFVLTTIFVALLAAGLTFWFGLSMALGAFLAGMMLGESQYRHQLEADIRPFRDILMGLFFITIGMRLDLSVMIAQLHWILLGAALLMPIKAFIIRASAWLFKGDPQDAWASGIKLCQIGEFSFVIAALAVNNALISQNQASLFISVGLLSMALTPLLVNRSLVFAQKLVTSPISDDIAHSIEFEQGKYADHVLIFGFGRVGQSVSRLLKKEAISFLAVDADPVRVQEARSAGEPVTFGDVSQKDILRAVGVEQAKLVLLTFDEPARAVNVVELVSSLNPDVPIVVRTRKVHHLEALYMAGASQVVPEILEGSLMLASQVLHLSGVPMSRILKRVRIERKGHYRHMQGIFPGESTEINYETHDRLELMHAVSVTHQANANGKTISDLNLSKMRVSVKGLRRNNVEIAEPDDNTVVMAGDVLVIAGKPRRVERAERYLLFGNEV